MCIHLEIVCYLWINWVDLVMNETFAILSPLNKKCERLNATQRVVIARKKNTHTCGCWTSLFSAHRIIHFLEATLVDCLWTHNVFVRLLRLRVKKNHYSTLSSTWDAATMAKGVSTLQNQLDLCIKRGQWICFAFEMNVLKVLLPYPPPSIDSSYVNVLFSTIYSLIPYGRHVPNEQHASWHWIQS